MALQILVTLIQASATSRQKSNLCWKGYYKLHYDTEQIILWHRTCIFHDSAIKFVIQCVILKICSYTLRGEGNFLLPGIKDINILVYHAHESVAF